MEMKQLIIIALLAFYGDVSKAQHPKETVSTITDSNTAPVKKVTAEERLKQQEQDIRTLKRDNEMHKKELRQLKSSLPIRKRKFTVSRVGSKQVVAE